jgi:fatty acid desaturase
MIAFFFLLISVSLRVGDHLYYRDPAPVLRLLRLTDTQDLTGRYYRRFDPLFATFPFIWAWSDLFLLALVAGLFVNPAVYLAVVVLAGTRFRVLQEASHIAVHGGLCRSRRWQWSLSNLAAQWPCFRPDMHHRFLAHVKEHHAHANDLYGDPNIARFISVGLVPGISRRQILAKLLRPLSPRGVAESVRLCWTNSLFGNLHRWEVAVRLAMVSTVSLLLWITSGAAGLTAAYVVPMVTVYPLFSWISVLAEHRWYVGCDASDRRTRECVNGRPTDYRRLGRVATHTIFPFTDHYHLAHSLYPTVRWNYLRAVDRELRQREPRYARYASLGLFRAQPGRQSALSELFDRLTIKGYPDLAEWAKDLGPQSIQGVGRASTITV